MIENLKYLYFLVIQPEQRNKIEMSKHLYQLNLSPSVLIALAIFTLLRFCPSASADPGNMLTTGSAPSTLPSEFSSIRQPYLDTHPLARPTLDAEKALQTGPGPIKDHPAPDAVIQSSAAFPPHTSTTVISGAKVGTIGMAHINQAMGLTTTSQPEAPLTLSGVLRTDAALGEQDRQIRGDPENARAPTLAAASALSNYAANNMAGAAVSQSQGAIEFTRHYLVNFTAQAGSSWQSLRNNLFIPIAILLLLPGAVLAQVRAIIAQGSSVLGEVSPFEGITRSIIAIFMIPASFLVVNYGIDLANALTYGISNQYFNLFGTDMYQDAECAEMRAFPANSTSQNMNALLPFSIPMPPMGKDPWTSFEGVAIANKLFDPCVGLNQSLIPDEASSSLMNTNRMMMNGTNAFLAMTWNIMCAFQTVFLYYLWCMGPIAAALWVWPMERMRSALPSWIEGVITLCFWSLFWNVVVLLIACFRGVSETGTVIMTALNGLAPISVWYAFDFSALVSEGAGYSMMNSISQAIGQASKGGGGANNGGGANKQSGGGGARQSAGGGMAPGMLGSTSGANSMANAGLSGGGLGASSGIGGSVPGSLALGGMSGMQANRLSGLTPGGGGVFSTASMGGLASSSNFNALDKSVQSELSRSQQSQSMNQQQIAQQNQARLNDMQRFASEQAQKQQQATLADYVNARRGEGANAAMFTQQQQQQKQEAERQLQLTNAASFLANASTGEKDRLANLFNSRLPAVGADLPPSTFSSGANIASAGDIGPNNIALAGGPPVPGDFARGSIDGGAPGGLAGADLPPLPPPPVNPAFTVAGLQGPPPVVTSSIYGDTLPVFTTAYTTSDTTAAEATNYLQSTDSQTRSDASVNWETGSDGLRARDVIAEQSAFVQPVNYNQAFAEQQQLQQQQQQVQYVPAEVKQEKIEVVQQAPKQVQETIVQQQPAQPSKPNVQKPVNNIMPVLNAPPAVQKPGGISSVLAGLQKGGGNPSKSQNANQNMSGGSLSRDSNAADPGQESTTTGSLGEHLSRLNRGGGRTADKAKDILSDLGLPPQEESDDEEEKKDS